MRGQTAHLGGVAACQVGQIAPRLGLADFVTFLFHLSLCSRSHFVLPDVRAPIGFPLFHFRWHPRSMSISPMLGSTRIRTGNVWQSSACKLISGPTLPITVSSLPRTF